MSYSISSSIGNSWWLDSGYSESQRGGHWAVITLPKRTSTCPELNLFLESRQSAVDIADIAS